MSQERPDITLVRLFVDGELEPVEREQFERRLESDESLRLQVEFEQQLRQHVARVMDDGAPAGIDERVRGALRDDAPAAGDVAGKVTPEADAATPSRLTRWLANPRQANAAAVAASLALVAGAVLWGIFGRPLDHVRPPMAGVASEVPAYVADEHVRCIMDEDVLAAKSQFRDPRPMLMEFARYLGAEPVLPDLRPAGYEFYGGGYCAVPGHDRSVHFVYRRTVDGRPVANVSIFAAPDAGQFDELIAGGLVPGRWYQVSSTDPEARRVDCTTDGVLIYLVVCCDERDVGAVDGLIGASLQRGPR